MIFVTEPLYTVEAMSCYQQIELTKKILRNYDEDKIIIKPHPADIIEYENFFPKCEVIRENFPFELLVWSNDIYIKKCIYTAYSNDRSMCFLNDIVDCKLIDYYDLEGNPLQ